MSYEDRIGAAAYTSPSGVRIAFSFEDVSKKIQLKAQTIDFVGVNGSYVQQSGVAGREFPLDIFFTGPNHDIESDKFENALVEQGTGQLEHPAYGVIKKVKPVGSIERSNRMVDEANQTVFSVTFQQTLDDLYPSDAADTSAAIEVAVAELGTAVGRSLSGVDIADAGEKASFLAKAKALAAGAKNTLQSASSAVASAQRRMDSIQDAINSGINIGIATPLLIAFQIQALIQSPARIKAQVKARLDAFGNLAASIVAGDGAGSGGGISSVSRAGATPGVVPADGSTEAANTFRANGVVGALAVGGMALVIVGATGKSIGEKGGGKSNGGGAQLADAGSGESIDTQEDAVQAVAAIVAVAESLRAWGEANNDAAIAGSEVTGAERSFAESLDTGELQAAVANVTAAVKAHISRVVSSLASARVHVTDADTTLLQLGARLYGDPVGAMNKLIIDNEFNANEILMVPRGTKVTYYA